MPLLRWESKGLSDVRMGKYVELKIDGNSEAEARRATDEVCKKLLANPVMEDYDFEIERASARRFLTRTP